jgi:hypothetical protein
MSSKWKKVLLVAVLVVGVGLALNHKNNYSAPATETPKTEQVLGEKRSYDQNSPPLTDADIYAAVQIANTEPSAEVEEERDGALITSDNEALNNFNNASYASTNF